MKLKPLGDRLIVKAVEEEATTASGIVLPDTAKEKPQKGKVLAVGDGKLDDNGQRQPLDVVEGGGGRQVQAELDPRVRRVHALTARAGGVGEAFDEFARGDDQPAGCAGAGGDAHVAGAGLSHGAPPSVVRAGPRVRRGARAPCTPPPG